MAKTFELALLLDIYGDMLTERQYDTLTLYYDEDYSLAEIAQLHGISRQGVHKCIRSAEAYLIQLEETLMLAEKFQKVTAELKKLQTVIDNSSASESDKAKIRSITEKIKKSL